jgi:hypothetical protein
MAKQHGRVKENVKQGHSLLLELMKVRTGLEGSRLVM